MALAQAVLRGDKPAVRIEGDVQLAAEVNWLADHVRWDMEEDLARIVGDVPAHTLGQMAADRAHASAAVCGQGSGVRAAAGSAMSRSVPRYLHRLGGLALWAG